MYYYAQINASNKCIGISMLSGKVNAPHMIEITEEQYISCKLLGCEYLGNGEWGSPPEPPSPPEPIPGLEDRVSELERALGVLAGGGV